jgi:predicted enzyme related to lactoylglutathione lyase
VDIRIQSVIVDSADCERLARFWSEALGWRITFESDEEYVIEPPEGSREVDVAPDILFGKVPDRKIVKNRLHFDLRPKDQEAEVQRILSLGATRVDIGQRDVSWVVLADPEGNEFCVLAPLPPSSDG